MLEVSRPETDPPFEGLRTSTSFWQTQKKYILPLLKNWEATENTLLVFKDLCRGLDWLALAPCPCTYPVYFTLFVYFVHNSPGLLALAAQYSVRALLLTVPSCGEDSVPWESYSPKVIFSITAGLVSNYWDYFFFTSFCLSATANRSPLGEYMEMLFGWILNERDGKIIFHGSQRLTMSCSDGKHNRRDRHSQLLSPERGLKHRLLLIMDVCELKKLRLINVQAVAQ